METTGIAPAPDTDKPVASNIGTEAFGSIARKLLFPVTSLFSSYNMLLTKYPLPTKITTSAIVGGAGDLLIQYMTMRKTGVMAAYAYRRMLVFATVCGLYYAPIVNLWYYLLTQLPLPKNTPYSKKVVAMVVVDQTAGSLSIVTGFFFAFELANRLFPPYIRHDLNFLQAGTISLKANFWQTLKANWCCWPFINLINFSIIPLQYRVLFKNFAALFWNIYLSSIVNAAPH